MSSNAPIPDVAQVFVNWSVHGALIQNALFFRHWTGPVAQADLDLLRDRLVAAFRFNFLQSLGAGVVLRSIECADRSVGSTLTSVAIINRPTFTLIPAAPVSIALGLKQYISSLPDPHPSRAFISGIRETEITGNFFDTAAADAKLSLWSTNNASHGPFGWHHVKVSLFSAGMPRPYGIADQIAIYQLQSYRVSQQQRRQE